MKGVPIFVAVWMFAAGVQAEFDASQVVDFDIRIDGTGERIEQAPFPLVLGESILKGLGL